jgi:signal transduction histidine kinase
MRRRLPAGLRWRLMLALVATSAVTLGATALVVLPPLQDRLRDQSAESLQNQVAAAQPKFQAAFASRDEAGASQSEYLVDLGTLAAELNEQSNARVMVIDDKPMVDSELPLGPADLTNPPQQFMYDSEAYSDTPRRALLLGLRVLRQGTTEVQREGDDVVVAMPLYSSGPDPTAALIADRQLTEAATLVEEVRTRFLIAAVVGLAVAVLLAIALSSTLLRRLGRLRAVALRITREGPDAPTPRDERRDEVGDLGRALTRMQEELRRQEAARRAFVSTASHELRTPLTMLQGTMELLEEDIRSGRLDELEALRQVSDARTQLNRLSALSGELLDLSRLDAAVPMRSEPVELGEIVRAVAAEFELRARERSTSIAAILPEGACWGRGDPDAVARVVRILLDNALRYGPRGAPVRIEAHSRDGRAVITVADQGPGIPEEERDRIFERFHRGTAQGSAGGFGLGLAIGRELGRRMGGELEVDSDGARGTRFVLTLHLAHAPADPPRDRVSA